MKNLFSSFLFLLASNFVFGQIEWVGNHAFSDGASDIFRTSQNQYVLVHNGITVFDSVGNILYSGLNDYYPNGNWCSISELVELSDSSIIFMATCGQCGTLTVDIIKFDKNWNELFTLPGGSRYDKADRLSNDHLILGSNYGDIERRDANGNLIWNKHLPLNDLTVLPSDTILLATDYGILKMSAEGEVADSFSDVIFQRIELLPNGNLLAQDSNELLILHSDFSQISAVQDIGMPMKDLDFNQDEIVVLTFSNKVIRLNYDLEQIDEVQLANHNQAFYAISTSIGGFVVGGAERYGNAEHNNYSAFIKEFSNDGSSINTGEDVALVSVNITGNTSILHAMLWNINFSALELEVQNLGQSPIKSLMANIELPPLQFGWDCGVYRAYSKAFNNLNILPGETGTLTWYFLSIDVPEEPTSGQTFELCFWTSLPDHHLETNNDNDVACTEVLVAAHEPFPIAFYHAFNAVADVLYLEMKSQVDAANANLFNATGQLVYTAPIDGQSQNLDLSGLPDGAYFLQIVSGERVGWGKFAKY